MTDRHLVKCFSQKYPCIEKIYEEACGFIHLSDKHIFSIFTNPKKSRQIEIAISSKDEGIPIKIYLEGVDIFIKITEILFDLIEGWIFTKNNPELIEKIRKKLEKSESLD